MNLDQNAKVIQFFNVFKGQSILAVTNLLHKYNLIVIHVWNNHKNLFQLFYISVNKSANYFFADKYQDWCNNEALN